jgi:glycerol-3-phosphate dehydrogenase
MDAAYAPRPLLAGESDQTSKFPAREHIVAHTVPGLVVVAGGKWTTHRIMAKDAIDAAAAAPRRANVPEERDPGHRAARVRRVTAGVEQAGKDRQGVGVHKVRIEHLLNRHGVMTDELLDLIRETPSLNTDCPVPPHRGRGGLCGNARGRPCTSGDAGARRTRISIEAWDRESPQPRSRRAWLMGDVLGWDAARGRDQQLPQTRTG